MKKPQANHNNAQYSIFNSNLANSSSSGFTLLELMVALAIFAVLTVFGWQSFNGLTQTKERVEAQSGELSDLQYAYLQIQNDMAQVVPWQDQKGQSFFNIDTGLDSAGIQFVRYADPDPRYANTPNLVLVNYFVADGALIRKQSYQLPTVSSTNTQPNIANVAGNTGISSVILNDISSFKIQPLFKAKNTGSNNQNVQQSDKDTPLPQAVSMEFNWQNAKNDIPILWQFILPNPKVNVTVKPSNTNAESTGSNSNDDNQNASSESSNSEEKDGS